MDDSSQSSASGAEVDGNVARLLTITSLCSQILAVAQVDARASFDELGGDSLQWVYFAAALPERLAQSDLSIDASWRFRPLCELGVALRPTAAATSRPHVAATGRPQGIPDLPNRYSYFFRRRRNLLHWNCCTSTFQSHERVSPDTMRAAVAGLSRRHDGLRLQLCRDGTSRIAPATADTSAIFTHRLLAVRDGDESQRAIAVRQAAEAIPEHFAFDRPLFHVLLCSFSDGAPETIFVAVHHLLVDAIAIRMVVSELFASYDMLVDGKDAELSFPASSFASYAIHSASATESLTKDHLRVWTDLPWHAVQSLVRDATRRGENREQWTHTIAAQCAVSAAEARNRYVISGVTFTFRELLVAAITRAYCRWFGHPALALAMVFHGRESQLGLPEASRVVGWLSDTIPLVLVGDQPASNLLTEVKSQLQRASVEGKALGMLRTRKDDLGARARRIPMPEVSLNYIAPSLEPASFGRSFHRRSDVNNLYPDHPSTERVFILSGGAWFENGAFHLAWDFSERCLDASSVKPFLDGCLAELTQLMQCPNDVDTRRPLPIMDA